MDRSKSVQLHDMICKANGRGLSEHHNSGVGWRCSKHLLGSKSQLGRVKYALNSRCPTFPTSYPLWVVPLPQFRLGGEDTFCHVSV